MRLLPNSFDLVTRNEVAVFTCMQSHTIIKKTLKECVWFHSKCNVVYTVDIMTESRLLQSIQLIDNLLG